MLSRNLIRFARRVKIRPVFDTAEAGLKKRSAQGFLGCANIRTVFGTARVAGKLPALYAAFAMPLALVRGNLPGEADQDRGHDHAARPLRDISDVRGGDPLSTHREILRWIRRLKTKRRLPAQK